jgi:hypothetical protein
VTQPRPDDALAREAQALARYLLDADCPPDLAERYGAAILRRSFAFSPEAVRVAQFAITRPWSLPYIAAAAPFFGSGSQLRWKLTVMSAVLETTPRFASDFLPRDLPLPRVLGELALTGFAALARASLGAPLLLVARFAR